MISIIIPTYNSESTIKMAIDSVLKQTIAIHEVIIVDDGSTDNTPEICDAYAANYAFVKVIHKQNGGVSSARNCGLKVATGDLIGFVDSDDWVEPDMFEVLLNAMQENNADLAACGMIQVSEEGESKDLDDGSIVCYDGIDSYGSILYSTGIRGYLCNKLLKKELITQGLNEEIAQCEDLLFITHYMHQVKKSVYVNRALYYYVRPESNTGFTYSSRSLTLMQAYELILQEYRHFAPKYVPLVETYTLKIYLNYRARVKLTKEKNPVIKNMIREGVQRHMKSVMESRDVSWKQKVNIMATYTAPRTMLHLKRWALNVRHKKGKWES